MQIQRMKLHFEHPVIAGVTKGGWMERDARAPPLPPPSVSIAATIAAPTSAPPSVLPATQPLPPPPAAQVSQPSIAPAAPAKEEKPPVSAEKASEWHHCSVWLVVELDSRLYTHNAAGAVVWMAGTKQLTCTLARIHAFICSHIHFPV